MVKKQGLLRIGNILTALVGLIVVCLPAGADEAGFDKLTTGRAILTPAESAEVIQAVHVNPPPVIDGVLDDQCWSIASKVDSFEYEGKAPLVKTIVYFCYDDKNLYFAFDCKDDKPEQISAQQKKRNGDIWGDDCAEIYLDCLHDHRNSYDFAVNACGTQYEWIPGGSAEKIEWRGDWRTATKINSDGWTVEIEIPFGILRYPKGQTTFGLEFSRNFRRAREWYNYPRFGNSYDALKEIDWTGLVTPVIKRDFVYMPYTLAISGDDGGAFTGMDIKRTFDNNVVTAFTIRPDFKTIEQSVSGIDFSYNPQYLGDNRPFFTEGSGYFGDSYLLYSRRVDEIDVGAKVFGKVGPNKFGALTFADLGNLNGTYLSYGWEPNTHFRTETQFFDCSGSDMDGSVAKLRITADKRYTDGGLYASVTHYRSFDRTGGYGEGSDLGTNLGYWHNKNGSYFSTSLNYNDLSPDFHPPLGYVNDLGTRITGLTFDYGKDLDNGPIRSWGLHLSSAHKDKYGGDLLEQWYYLDSSISLRNNTGAGFSVEGGRRPPNNNLVWHLSCSWRTDDLYRGGGIRYKWGKEAGADYRYISLDQGFKLGENWSVGLDLEHMEMDYPEWSGTDDLSRNWLQTSLMYDITPEKSLGVSFRMLNKDANAYLSYRQELRVGTDIFLLIGDPNSPETKGQFAVKLVRVL